MNLPFAECVCCLERAVELAGKLKKIYIGNVFPEAFPRKRLVVYDEAG